MRFSSSLVLFFKLILLALQDVLEAQCGMIQHNENLLWNSFLMLFNSLNEQPRVRRYRYLSNTMIGSC